MCVSLVGRVTETQEERARVLFGEQSRWVATGLHPEVRPGDYVMVQTGLILDIISEAEALELERFQRELDVLLEGNTPIAEGETAHRPHERAG